jgi:hypothetical protein
MFATCALMEEGECGCFVSPNLDVGWIGLQKDDELLLKGGGFASVVFNF